MSCENSVPRKKTDVRAKDPSLFFLPIEMRLPLKFGSQTVSSVVCARVRLKVADAQGRCAEGWGEVPLSVAWAWPSDISYAERLETIKQFCCMLAEAWQNFAQWGHALEIGHDFQQQVLPQLLQQINESRNGREVPYLAALVCCSAFDVALHDAYGNMHGRDIYETYNAEFLSRDLSAFLSSTEDANTRFAGLFPQDFFVTKPPKRLKAWHLVGGLDPITSDDLTGNEPDDGHPVILTDWIARDGLDCLKVKLRGNDTDWDYNRLVRVGTIAIEQKASWLTADFNCMVSDVSYVNDILDRLCRDHARIWQMLLYVEQPFPYDLEKNRIDVRSVAARKPIFLDESAHDWKYVALGRELGWSGVALKTCKTQTGALLSLCWAKAHGMPVMVQDLTNPMLAQIPHVRLAAHSDTIMGVETNAMQFYPAASDAEAAIHPGLYQRRGGKVDLSTIAGSGFGYRLGEMHRELPDTIETTNRSSVIS
jgi:L-alanine-DL-glutamate epimerase-like enolase superfamily enzyme